MASIQPETVPQEPKEDVQEMWFKVLERPEFKEMKDSIPKITSALMEEMLIHKSVEIRKRLKSILNALLTIVGTDTEMKDSSKPNSYVNVSTGFIGDRLAISTANLRHNDVEDCETEELPQMG